MPNTEDLQLLQSNKDTLESCVFDYPDRPVESLPPEYPPVDPPHNFPNEPELDWPFIPPEDRPDPDFEPPEEPDIFPPINPPIIFSSLIAYERDVESGGELFFGLPPTGVIDFSFGSGTLIATVLLADRMTPRNIAGPILLAETGFTATAAGVRITFCQQGTELYIYFSYWAQYFNGGTGDNVFSIAPVPSIAGPAAMPNSAIGQGTLSITIAGWDWIGTTPVDKNITTAALFLLNDTIPLNITIP